MDPARKVECPLCKPIGSNGGRNKLFGLPICPECEKKLDRLFNPRFKTLFTVTFPMTSDKKQSRKEIRKEMERDEAFEASLLEE